MQNLVFIQREKNKSPCNTVLCTCAPSFHKIMHHSCHGDAYTNEIKNFKNIEWQWCDLSKYQHFFTIITIMHHSCHGDFYINEIRNIKIITILVQFTIIMMIKKNIWLSYFQISVHPLDNHCYSHKCSSWVVSLFKLFLYRLFPFSNNFSWVISLFDLSFSGSLQPVVPVLVVVMTGVLPVWFSILESFRKCTLKLSHLQK